MKYNPHTHFYLYAKGWYKEEDIVKDLKVICANYSGIELKWISDADVFQVLYPVVWKEIQRTGNPEYFFGKFVVDVKEHGYLKAFMIILSLSLAVGLNLGEPDYSILPKSE
jgi:hypothetical protein